MRVLIIEDELAISEPLKLALEKRNFAVDLATDGKSGLDKALINTYDCILLDLNLPEMDGLEVAKKLRESENFTPILMLTARTTINNKYEGFEHGTDDYLTKPFDFKELLLRIQSLIKRSSIDRTLNLSAGDVTLDVTSLTVNKNGKLINLNAKEYGILEYLLRKRGKIVSQEELLEHVWNEEIDSLTQTVKTNIKTLRKKIDPKKIIIKTFKGRGYVIE
jgi:DNA-binding response OmpR family regulator